MTINLIDTLAPTGAFPVALAGDIARPSGASVEVGLQALEVSTAAIQLSPVTQADDDIATTPPLPVALAFAEKDSKRARSFILQGGGFAAKVFAFMFGGQPSDDDTGSPVWGLRLDDGKMPLQADGSWKFYMKFQDRTVAAIGATLGLGLKSLWRASPTVTDVTVSDTMMRARVADTTVSPGWLGQLVLPKAGAATFAIADSNRLDAMVVVAQSNGAPAGVNNNSALTTAQFPYHALRPAAARLLNGDPTIGGQVWTAAQLADFAALQDDAGTAGYIMTDVAFMEQRRARAMGERCVPMACAYAGFGGIPLNYLRKTESTAAAPKYFYGNAQNFFIAKAGDARARGMVLAPSVLQVQGENTSVPTGETYLDIQYKLITDHLADTLANTGFDLTAYLLLQTNGLSNRTDPQFTSARAHLTCARLLRGSRFVIVAPMYQCALAQEATNVANIHADAPSKLMLGDLINRARNALLKGQGYRHLDIARTSVPALSANQTVRAPGVATGTMINGTGAGGGVGSYPLSGSAQTVALRKMEAFGAIFYGSIAGTTLTVATIVEGAFDLTINGSDVTIGLERSVQIDLDRVPDVGPALGWGWTCSAGRAITSVSVAGRYVTLHLNGAPGTTRTVGYADLDCGPAYGHFYGDTGTNWAAARGPIYADSGIEAMAWRYHAAGTPTIRDYLVRLQETF